MIEQTLVKSALDPSTAVYRKVVGAGDYWIHEIAAGMIFRIADLEGNQAVDTIFYSARETSERYSAIDARGLPPIRTSRCFRLACTICVM